MGNILKTVNERGFYDYIMLFAISAQDEKSVYWTAKKCYDLHQSAMAKALEEKDKQISELKEDIVKFAEWVDDEVVYNKDGKMEPSYAELYAKYQQQKNK